MKRPLLLILVLVTWSGCGFEIYLVHVNHGLQQQIRDSLRRLDDATRQTNAATERLKQETERLQQLRKSLPPQPAPDRRSKL